MRAPARARRQVRRGRRPIALAAATALACAGALAAAASGADGPPPPAPCDGVPQITDVAGDGHHVSSDVLSAWLSEATGSLQAVIRVRSGTFVPEHDDADVNGSGFALLFTLGGRVDYVRARAAPDGSLTYDYGTYASGTSFTSLGATTGSVVHGEGAGTATIDVPAALGATPGSVLADPFVLTYDGITGGVPGWVDHAPGGVAPDDPARGADYVVGSCDAGGGGTTAPGGGSSSGGGGVLRAVRLSAPATLVGGGRAIVSGQVVPAAGGIAVTITRSAHATRVSHVRTSADGSFALAVRIGETTRVRAAAGALRSGTQTIDVRSRTRIRVQRERGAVWLRGSVAPALPGMALLLPADSPTVLATRRVAGGRFAFRFARERAPRGALQVVYVPAAGRAERSTSNTVRAR